ncbi:EamA family transporter [Oceanobacillus alkalisoli]|uniref:EamA family transporter n=1 Tax=Oceanobacillus alkalisoli TaxID=2925113 RepID=UPI001EF01B2E|nr:EamA family transporter [Oceanobacillus alkalisoli]MCF3943922.1 EamA family transporter [Oceanobacillus alkalisoli]MCG5104572.1 EamA family transporter [Oceanobacillus alkalisoli]
MDRQNRKLGFLLVIIGATLWGVGGTVSQKLFQDFQIEVDWLVTVRLLISGVLLLTIQYLSRDKKQVFDVWKNKRNTFQLLIFGLFGMLAVQYTFMASINHGNAAVATLLQYQAPIMIIAYLLIQRQMRLRRMDLITVFLSLSGCFLLLTNGSLSGLSVPAPAVIWGILSGVALAFYTLYAASLLAYFDSLVIVGWAMVIGGVTLSFIHPPWQMDFASLPLEGYLYLLFIVIFGTMIAFWFFIESLNSLSPKETSLVGSLEPLAAVLTTVFWLKEPFGSFQWLGTACVIAMIVFMALADSEKAAFE